MYSEFDVKKECGTKYIDGILTAYSKNAVPELFQDLFCAGHWAGQKMREMGVPEPDAEHICHQIGRMAFAYGVENACYIAALFINELEKIKTIDPIDFRALNMTVFETLKKRSALCRD